MELVKKKSKLVISTLKHQLLGRRGDVLELDFSALLRVAL